MKTLNYALLLSLPLALSAIPGHADADSMGVRNVYQSKCEFLLHGDVSTLDLVEYQARWNECFGGIKLSSVVAVNSDGQTYEKHAGRAEVVHPVETKHRPCQGEAPRAAGESAGEQADDRQVATESERHRSPPRSTARKHRHKR